MEGLVEATKILGGDEELALLNLDTPYKDSGLKNQDKILQILFPIIKLHF